MLKTIKRDIKKLISSYIAKRTQSIIRKTSPLKIIVGSGGVLLKGWVATDISILDVTNKLDWIRLFGDRRMKYILAEHVFEHIHYDAVIKAWKLCFEYLEPKGRLRIAVPDRNHASSYVRNLTQPGGIEPGAEDHQFFWDYRTAEKELKEIGFIVDLIEYFDDDGFFHCEDWNEEYGFVSRCSTNYMGRLTSSDHEYNKMIESVPEHLRFQFKEKNISYTSLFLDAIKP